MARRLTDVYNCEEAHFIGASSRAQYTMSRLLTGTEINVLLFTALRDLCDISVRWDVYAITWSEERGWVLEANHYRTKLTAVEVQINIDLCTEFLNSSRHC